MKKMVISCFPNGHVEHILKDTFFNPKLGRRSIKRITDIVFDEEAQKFRIKFLELPITINQLFDSYEEAVEYEINFINDLRERNNTSL